MRMNLEVKVRRRRERIAGVADEADHVAGLDALRVQSERRIAREMRVVELVAYAVAYPEPPAAEALPADAVERAVRDGDDGRAERGEDVVAVVPVPGNVAAEPAVRVAVTRAGGDREHVVPEAERRRHRQRIVAQAALALAPAFGLTASGLLLQPSGPRRMRAGA